MVKICNKCRRTSDEVLFHKGRASCKECDSAYSRGYRALHKEELNAKSRLWHKIHSKKDYERKLVHKAQNPKLWRERERLASRRKRSTPQGKLISNTRRRINKFLKGTARPRTSELLGCTDTEFRVYTESKFLPNMSWENRNLWHIDHIQPICSFDLTTLEGQKAAFHYTNTQPLWAVDNLRKGAKLPPS